VQESDQLPAPATVSENLPVREISTPITATLDTCFVEERWAVAALDANSLSAVRLERVKPAEAAFVAALALVGVSYWPTEVERGLAQLRLGMRDRVPKA
jgi:hypothetical protein